MDRLNELPCIAVQDGPLLLACNAMHPEDHDNIGGHAHVSDCTHLGDDDPEMERLYRANGSLAKVTFFDIRQRLDLHHTTSKPRPTWTPGSSSPASGPRPSTTQTTGSNTGR